MQRYLYANAGFSKLSDIEGLSDEPYRFDVSERHFSCGIVRDLCV